MAKRSANVLDSAGVAAESAIPTFDSLMKAARPLLKEGKKIARQKAKQAQKVAKAESRAAAKTAVRTVTPEDKGNKVKKLLLLGGLVAIVSVIARRFMGDSSKGSWQPAYTPAPAPSPQPTPEPEPDDVGGSSPDEAIADEAAEPHADSTPDNPVEVVEIEEQPDVSELPKPDPLSDPLPTDQLSDPLTDPLPEESAAAEAVEETETPKKAKKSARPAE
jgi:hypothetical protein